MMTRSTNSDCTLVIMAKAPRPGMVKTRLAQSLPPAAAIELYRCLLLDTIALAQSLDDGDVAIMCPASDVEDLSRMAGDRVHVVAQMGDGLAAGLTSVFAKFASVGHRRVIAFNSDSPHLPASALKRAFEALVTCDLVIGPTDDGGYYIVGAKSPHPALFEGDGMGTKNALDALLERAHTMKLSVGFTDPFYDIDVMADVRRLVAELQPDPARAPRTARWLLEWGKTAPHAGLGGTDL
jgi:rSAM/selenodomain-associated transferase 1